MTTNNNIHPVLKDVREQVGKLTEEEQKKQEEEQLAINFLKSLRIHAKDHFDKPNFALYKNGIGFAPLGNIMAICAEAKNGKSWLMQQFALAMLKGEFCGLTSELTDPKVLYFDTEQDKYDTKMIQTRVHYVMGWPFDEDDDRFQLYSMDDFDKLYQDESIQGNRLIAIKTAIQVEKPNVIFIDGVRDLIFDFNDLAESAVLVQELMSMARRNNILICTVLHVNPNSEKMRGHLGTEMQNKTTDVFTVKKEDAGGGEKHFKVQQVAARHQDVEDWVFRISDQGKFHIPVLKEVDGEAPQNTEADKDQQARMMLNAAIGQGESMKFTTLRERIRLDNHIGSGKSKEVIDRGVKMGMLSCNDGTYTRIDTKTIFDTDNSMGDATDDPF